MTGADKERLVQAGMNLDSAMERFMGNEALLERFLRKFQDDKNFKQLMEAVESGDREQAFSAAHTLKGVSGNLSFDSLYDTVSKQVEEFRAGNWEGGVAMMDDVKEKYGAISETLKEILK